MSAGFSPKAACGIVAIMLLAGCAGSRPAVPLGASVVAPAVWRTSADEVGAIDAQWWRSFDDPQLTHLVEDALAANPDIAIAATRVAEARAQYRLAKAQTLPDLVLQAGGVHEREVSPFGRGETQYASRGELSISYDVDLFGRLSSTSAAARAALLSSEAAH